MQIVKLMGGLGNQMFQYAFAKLLSDESGENVLFDLGWYDDSKKDPAFVSRQYMLEAFNIKINFATPEQVKITLNERKSIIPKRICKILNIKHTKTNRVLEKNAVKFEPELYLPSKEAYYEGYFQCEKYFLPIRDEILEEFSLKEEIDSKNEEVLEEVRELNSVSLHVRRGDYISNPSVNEVHGTCSLDYYSQAINYIASNIECPNFYLFSDDVNWVKENLKIDYPFTVIDFNQNKDWLDINLMKNCKHNIIANSSFSWWGAWLNQNVDKIVIAPQKWFNNANISTQDLLPSEWIKF